MNIRISIFFNYCHYSWRSLWSIFQNVLVFASHLLLGPCLLLPETLFHHCPHQPSLHCCSHCLPQTSTWKVFPVQDWCLMVEQRKPCVGNCYCDFLLHHCQQNEGMSLVPWNWEKVKSLITSVYWITQCIDITYNVHVEVSNNKQTNKQTIFFCFGNKVAAIKWFHLLTV